MGGTLRIYITPDKEFYKNYITRHENTQDIQVFNLNDTSRCTPCQCKKVIPDSRTVLLCDDFIDINNKYKLFLFMSRKAFMLKLVKQRKELRMHIFINKLDQKGIESIIENLKLYIKFDTVIIALS